MPRLNGKGPNGEGQGTGRQLGKCNPAQKESNEQESSQNSTPPMHNGAGLRRGAGAGNRPGKGMGQGNGKGGRLRGNSQS